MGTVVLSVDAELGWGFHDLANPPRDRLLAARDGWQTLLALCDEYDVPATWAVVGHLLLSDCDGRHDDHPASAEWFASERGPDGLAAPLRFGDGLVDAIVEAEADHEVASHTFSHVEFGAPETTREVAAAEVEATNEAARRRGLDLTSFVFPRNRVGHREVLAEHDIRCYRGVQPSSGSVAERFGALEKLLRATVKPTSPPLVTPTVEPTGLVNVPASLYLFGFEGLARSVAEPIVGDPIVEQAQLGIDRAARSEGVFHMWLHPNNLTTDRDVDRLASVFSYLDQRRREESSLSVQTMAQVAMETVDEVDLVRAEAEAEIS